MSGAPLREYLKNRMNTRKLATSISVENLSTLEATLDWNTMAVSDQEFEDAKFIFDRSTSPIGTLSEDELYELSRFFDDESLVELGSAKVKSANGQCKCGRTLNVYDILKKAFDNSVHSVRFIKDVIRGDKGKFLICGTDGSQEDKNRMPAKTIWVPDTKPTECIDCGEPHQLLLLMHHLAHNWVLNVNE